MTAPWLALLALALSGGRGHPMHTAVAELAQGAGGRASIQIRVYADDLEAALAAQPDAPTRGTPPPTDGTLMPADSVMARYLRGTFALADRAGRPVRLTWAGVERTGDVILLRLRGEVPGGLAGARVTSLVLCERFEDQVNVVRAVYAGRAATLLFTRGETSKVLP